MFSNSDYVKMAVRLGASGYIVKDSSIDQMAFALQEVFAGRRYFGGDLLLQFFNSEHDESSIEKNGLEGFHAIEDKLCKKEINLKFFLTANFHAKKIHNLYFLNMK